MRIMSDRSATEDLALPRPTPIRVLVVEDDPLVATYIADVLQETGFEVIGIASTGCEALSIARDTGADIALVDIMLAGPQDGIEVAGSILQLYGIGTIFLSGTSDPEIVERAGEVKPYGFLRKPFRPGQMYNMLVQALTRRAVTDAAGPAPS
ncbi:MAG: two-component system, response regulator PdtaR [Aliidongia sp.]|jgi:DNA-binding NarL/FixJ family response regulator|nr:two-component system, response regulator PdtaR [Aliidongia sp.]